MKSKRIRRIVFVYALCAILILMFGAGGASALEIARDATEISIPIALQSQTAIAGGDVEFHYSNGLEFVKFVPATGIDPGRVAIFPNTSDPNYAALAKEGRHMVGVFSSKNEYTPTGGSVLLGSLVFSYTGQSPETVTITETKTDQLANGSVSSNTTKLGFIIDITRASSGSGSGNGTGSGGTESAAESEGSSSTVRVVLPTASSATTSTTVALSLPDTDNEPDGSAGAASENMNSAASAGISGSNTGEGASEGALIGDGLTPLSGAGESTDALPPWALVIILALAAVIVLLLVFLMRKKKREETSRL